MAIKIKGAPRTLRAGQRCQVWIHDVASSTNTMIYETNELLLEAPNWTALGNSLILNGAGTLWRVPVDAPALEAIPISGVPPLNNDHVLDPDGKHIFMSAYEDWQLYRAPLSGGAAVKITEKENPTDLLHFLHGVSPDGKELAFVGITLDPSVDHFKLVTAEIYTVGSDGRSYKQITQGGAPTDGPEYSPDGQWIYFNTEGFSRHAQIARMRRDGSEGERLTFTDTVDWFPHLSPDGTRGVYLAFPHGTQGHPADLDVTLMLVENSQWRAAKPAARLFGGQGTINVNSWSPDSKRFAYVAYPLS